jgi:MarR family transcriptional regulator, 2-MHQ and catechol-resistance regulon repressor
MQDDRLERSLGYALARAFRRVNRAGNRSLRPHGLSAEQAHILIVLWIKGPMKIGELQQFVTLSSPTLSGAIDRMERASLVERVADPKDGRAWRLESGKIDVRKKKAVEKTLEEIESSCFSNLNAKERRQLLELLEKVGGAPAD